MMHNAAREILSDRAYMEIGTMLWHLASPCAQLAQLNGKRDYQNRREKQAASAISPKSFRFNFVFLYAEKYLYECL